MQEPEDRALESSAPEKAPFPTMPVTLAVVGVLILVLLFFL